MSFTTENNKENVANDSLEQESVSHGRRIAEERAERIRYADEYRRRLKTEREARLKKENEEALADAERKRAEKAAQEEAERRAKLEEEKLEAQMRLNAADEKIKEIASVESEAETLPEVVVQKAEEPVERAAEDSVGEERSSEEIIAEDTALNKEKNEVIKEEETHTMANSDRIVVHIPVKCFNASGSEVQGPATESVAAENVSFAPSVAAFETAPVEQEPVAPIAAMPVTVSPVTEDKTSVVAAAIAPVSVVKPAVAEPKPVTVNGGYKVIDVTENYRNDVFNSATISYGKVVTEGGWEHEIEDEDDVVVVPAETESVTEEIVVAPDVVEDNVAEEITSESEAQPVMAAVAFVDTDDAVAPVENEAPAVKEEPYAAAPARVARPTVQRNVPVPKNYDITEEYPAPRANTEEKAASVAPAPERVAPIVAPIPFTVKEGEFVKEPQVENKKKSGRNASNDFIFDPEKENTSRDDAEIARKENEEYGDRYDMHQIESEHLRYLTETKKLDKKSKTKNNKKADKMAVKNATNSSEIRKNAEKSAALVGSRMDYDAKFGSSDLSIELLKFNENDYFVEKENKRRLRLISKIRKSIKKAKKLERKATKRYYGVLAAETVKPTSLKKQKKQERLNSLIIKLEALLKEREAIDDRLILLYRGAETKSGGRVRARAEAKRYKVAKKVHNKLKKLNRSLEKLKAPKNLKIKIRYLLNTKIVSKSTLAYSKYMLKKLKPKGEAKRELKRDIARSKKSLYNIDKNIRRMMKKAYKYDGSHRKQGGLFRWIIALVILVAILGGCWYFFGDALMGMLGLA